MGSCSFSASQEVLPYYYNGTSTVLLEDQLYHRKTNCSIEKSIVLLEIDCIIGRSIAMLEDEWKIKGIIRKSAVLKTINWIRWKQPIKENNCKMMTTWVFGAECGASSFTWYLYQMCNTDVRLSVCLSHLFDYVPLMVSSWNFQELLPMTKVSSMQKVKVGGQRSRSQTSQPNLTVSGL